MKKILFVPIIFSFFILSACGSSINQELSFERDDFKTTVHVSKNDDNVNLYATLKNNSKDNKMVLYGEGTIMVVIDNTYYPDSTRTFDIETAIASGNTLRLSKETNIPYSIWEKGDPVIVVKYSIDGVMYEEKLEVK